jgi:uncharacterized membrane protein YedE/YeeE
VIIGLACTLLLATHGKVAGISNILDGAISREGGHTPWFVGGLVLAGLGAHFIHPTAMGSFVSLPVVVIAGLVVGVGSKVGNGCTSGHGMCGISRLSKRSLIATMTFMATGFVTVFVTEHVLR